MKKNITFRFHTELTEKLRELAKEERRTLNNYIENVLYEHIELKEEK